MKVMQKIFALSLCSATRGRLNRLKPRFTESQQSQEAESPSGIKISQ